MRQLTAFSIQSTLLIILGQIMTINLTRFSLTILAALTLTACGSSGGSSASNAPTARTSTPASQPSTQATQPSTPAAQPSEQAVLEMPKRSPTNTGVVFSIKTESEEDSVGQINTINNEQELSNRTLTSIDVDGKNIPIDFKFELNEDWTKEGEFIKERNLSPHICCGKYTHVRFGAIANHSYGQNDILFYNGIPSENVPKSGKVTYKGESIMADKGNVIFGSYRRGTSEFTVDFGKKELSGSLNTENRRYNTEINEYDAPKNVKVEIDAKISGNRFYGTAKSSTFVSEGITEGKFYGDNAKELGGMVKAKDNSWAGAYGAKAQ
ncbi:TPA: Slam-dependent surface lipoprotein [Haemophilus influenzae]